MPYLFVDYEQGAGGEFFCANLSKSPQCVELIATTYSNGRTKINDLFDQEWLKLEPVLKTIPTNPVLYDVVPTHRFTNIAQQHLGSILSIRIANPVDKNYWRFLKYQQEIKVLRTTEPTDKYFLGYLKILQKQYNNYNFVKKVKKGMDNLTLILLAKNIEPTEENKQIYLKKIYNSYTTEPDFEYNLVIKYEDLFVNPAKVKQQLFDVFGIEILTDWLLAFEKKYETYISET